MVTELRLALRTLVKQPGPSLVVVVTLGLALGANAAIFAAIDALAIRPFPFHDIGRLTVLAETDPDGGFIQQSVAPANFRDWKTSARSFDRLAAMDWWEVNLRGREEPERILGFHVSADFFPALGVHAALGRTFAPAEETPGQDRRAVLGHALWSRRFGSDPAIVGQTVLLDGVLHEVVGVAPPGFDFPMGTEVWAPLAFDETMSLDRTSRYLTVVGRLAPGVSIEEARAEMTVVGDRLEREYPRENRGQDVFVHPFTRGMMDAGLGPILSLWQAAAAFVLLIACANVASLLVARGVDRQRELAVRMAIGASRARIVGQLLTESVVLALASVPLALAMASVSLGLMRGAMPARIARFLPGWHAMDVDGRLVFFTIALGVAAAVIFGTLPALQTSRLTLTGALKEGGRGASAGAGRMRWRRALVAGEVALVMPLLVATLLSVIAASRFVTGPQGFDTDGLLTLRVVLPESTYADDDARRRFTAAAIDRLSALPGVTAVAAANTLPSSPSNNTRSVEIEGRPAADSTELPRVDARSVTPRYFDALRLPVLQGRGFTDDDRADAMAVTVVSASMARRFWPDADPIGRRFRVVDGQTPGPWLAIVGVSGDVIHSWFNRRNAPTFYQPFAQAPTGFLSFAARTAGGPEGLTSLAGAAIRQVDPAQPVFEVLTMARLLHDRTIGLQFITVVMGVFGLLALVLAIVGIYGAMAYLVSQRTHEIGVRVALGASRRDVIALVVGQAWRVTAVGVGVGVALAIALTRLIEAGLFGIVSGDPRLVALLAGLLMLAGILAGYLPARRATAIDPIIALRQE
jgi:putative ABC transport system permease protein